MQDIGKKILFYINKIENNTIHITEVLQTTSNNSHKDSSFLNSLSNNLETPRSFNIQSDVIANNVNSTAASVYDSSGAAKYIIVVVLMYGFGIIFFIGSQVRSTQKYSDEVDGVNAEKILRSMQTEIFTKEVLEKLSNKEHREKAWKIYRDGNDNNTTESLIDSTNHLTSSQMDENVKEVDKEAYESIERRLKVLKGQYGDSAEMETIKEVLKAKFRSNPVSRDSKKKKKSHERKNVITPKLILQTDVDGLMKMKESNKKLKHKSSSENVNNSTCSLKSNDDKRKSCESDTVKFDLFEVSEQITTV